MSLIRKCKKCGEEKSHSKFPTKHSSKGRRYLSHTCNSCKYYRAKGLESEQQKQARRDYSKEWIKRNRNYARYKAYRSKDLSRGFEVDSWESLRNEFEKPCYYCGSVADTGLDRRDNGKGHTLENVKPCCSKCNMIMGDIPAEAKDVLKSALTKIYKKGLLSEWKIPTKRS